MLGVGLGLGGERGVLELEPRRQAARIRAAEGQPGRGARRSPQRQRRCRGAVRCRGVVGLDVADEAREVGERLRAREQREALDRHVGCRPALAVEAVLERQHQGAVPLSESPHEEARRGGRLRALAADVQEDRAAPAAPEARIDVVALRPELRQLGERLVEVIGQCLVVEGGVGQRDVVRGQ
eukprot:scaffold80655_cov69-Phaeocystis_antarctica.AAC.2